MLAAGGGYAAEGPPEYGSGIETAFCKIISDTKTCNENQLSQFSTTCRELLSTQS